MRTTVCVNLLSNRSRRSGLAKRGREMSLKDKASRINFAGLPGVTPAPATSAGSDVEVRRPRTAPGAMMEFAQGQRSELLRENEELKAKAGRVDELRSRLDEALVDLQAWDGAK